MGLARLENRTRNPLSMKTLRSKSFFIWDLEQEVDLKPWK